MGGNNRDDMDGDNCSDCNNGECGSMASDSIRSEDDALSNRHRANMYAQDVVCTILCSADVYRMGVAVLMLLPL
jgi:hypothetical protein